MNSTALRDYTDMMHMEPLELSRYARNCVRQGVMSSALLEALADQLEALAELEDQIEALKLDLEEAEARARRAESYSAWLAGRSPSYSAPA